MQVAQSQSEGVFDRQDLGISCVVECDSEAVIVVNGNRRAGRTG